ncbi:MAG TPA: DnaJ family domain-containing protein [Burkholderiales bacterium]|nr:DnaJ family domain-containing protein [Burkholderiales bacterium]
MSLSFLDYIAEQKIEEAVRKGELDALPGSGKPLALDDDAHVPEDMRMAMRILRNAGLVPPEVQSMRDIADLECLLQSEGALDGAARRIAMRKLQLLRVALDEARSSRGALGSGVYLDRIVRRFA